MEETEGKNTPILVFSDLCVVDEALNVISDSIMYLQQQKANVADYHEVLFKNVVNRNAMMINRALADISLRCLAPEKTIMHDWWIAIAAARFGRISYIDHTTVLYRQHGGNDVGAKKARGIGFILRKLTHLKTLLASFDQKAAQARVFLDTFRDELEPEECLLLMPSSQRKMSSREKLECLLGDIALSGGFYCAEVAETKQAACLLEIQRWMIDSMQNQKLFIVKRQLQVVAAINSGRIGPKNAPVSLFELRKLLGTMLCYCVEKLINPNIPQEKKDTFFLGARDVFNAYRRVAAVKHRS